jgi:hemerythrin-like domain-containing protein
MIETDDSERIDQDDAETLVRFLRAFADEHHHVKEENMLFPELMRTHQSQGGPMRHLLLEHNQERSLVEGLDAALHSGKNSDVALFANRLADRVRAHIQKEDGILFPIIDVLITRDLDDKVSRDFEKCKLEAGLLDDLRRLESKYLNQTAP